MLDDRSVNELYVCKRYNSKVIVEVTVYTMIQNPSIINGDRPIELQAIKICKCSLLLFVVFCVKNVVFCVTFQKSEMGLPMCL